MNADGKINRIKVIMTEMGITRQELANRTGLSMYIIADMRNNKRQGYLEKLCLVADALDVDITDLLYHSRKNKDDTMTLKRDKCN